MRRLIIIILFIMCQNVFGDLEDFGFKPLRDKIRYKEDFLRLYNEWLYSDLDSISRNIFFLELAFSVPFDHPIKAIVPITNELQYERYKDLIFMHICLRLTDSYIKYGYMYMKENIYFFNEEFRTNYLQGYDIAEKYFRDANNYWNIALNYSKKAWDRRLIKTGLDWMEDENYKIQNKIIDYQKVINNLYYRINRNRKRIYDLWGSTNY